MRFQLDVVGESNSQQTACGQEYRGCREPHDERLKVKYKRASKREEKRAVKDAKIALVRGRDFFLDAYCQITFKLGSFKFSAAGKASAHFQRCPVFLLTTSYQHNLNHETSPTGHLRTHQTVSCSHPCPGLCCGIPSTLVGFGCASRVKLWIPEMRYGLSISWQPVWSRTHIGTHQVKGSVLSFMLHIEPQYLLLSLRADFLPCQTRTHARATPLDFIPHTPNLQSWVSHFQSCLISSGERKR